MFYYKMQTFCIFLVKPINNPFSLVMFFFMFLLLSLHQFIHFLLVIVKLPSTPADISNTIQLIPITVNITKVVVIAILTNLSNDFNFLVNIIFSFLF